MLAALLLGACGHAAESPAPAPALTAVEVQVAAPAVRELARSLRVSGSLQADQETTIAARVAGRVLMIAKDLGDEARPGETLLLLDPTDAALLRAERRRALEQALAQLGLGELPAGALATEDLPEVKQALARAANEEARYERGSRLTSRQPPVISEQELADLRAAWEVAAAQVEIERKTAAAALAQARVLEAQLRIAEQRLLDTDHRAPDPAGQTVYRVAERFVAVGDSVAVGAPLFRLVATQELKLRVPIPERHAAAIQAGQTARVRLEAYDEDFQGAVARIAPGVDEATRAFLAEIRLPNRDGRLKPGSFATAEIGIGSVRVLTIPEACVRRFAGLAKVLRVRDGKAEELRVTLGESAEGIVEVLSGLAAEDRLVLNPGAALVTGTPVILREDQGADAGPR